MSLASSRPALARAFAVAATVLLCITGPTLPAFAADDPVAPTVESVDTGEQSKQDAVEPAAEPPAEPGDAPTGDTETETRAETEPETDAETETEPTTETDTEPDTEPETDAPAAAAPAARMGLLTTTTVAAGNVQSGSASWSISELMGRAIMGFASPRAASYVAPATFVAGTPGVSTWGDATGSVDADGSAAIAFSGTSVNHASTGGGWLRLSDPEVHLDADGNGTLSAVAAYGTSTPPSNYDAAQSPVRGPVRVDLVDLSGNTAAQASVTAHTAEWTGLTGAWSAEFVAFVQGVEIPGVSAAATAWTYQSNITGATASSGASAGLTRTPAALTLSVALTPAPAVAYDDGSFAWSISQLMGRSVMGFASPRGASYVAPATFAAGTPGTSTWGGGAGTVAADGSATLSFAGTSVNHASTGGGWLRLADPQAHLDADGNGVLTAVVSYGTATPPSNYDAAQPPVRGPVRIDVVDLVGNSSAQAAIDADSATWTGLTGAWSADFVAFVQGVEIAGVSPAATPWTYQSNITGATATSGASAGLTRTPAPLTFTLGFQAPVVVTPTVALAASPAGGIVQGGAVKLTATVDPATDGTVEFRSGATVLGTAAVGADGIAVLVTSSLAAGAHALTAAFLPADAGHAAPASSPSVAFEVFAPVAASPGFLSWGVKGSFRSYIVTTAHGTVTLGGGAGTVGGVYRFPQAAGSTFDAETGLGSSVYRGSVAFRGHGGALAVTFSDPIVRLTSASTGALSVVAAGSGRLDLATLNLSPAQRSVDGTGATSYANVPATLTAAGATAFAGFYAAGEALDPVSFVIGRPAAALGGGVVAAATSANTPDATPPATDGVASDTTEFTEGDTATFTADGFQPGEGGILAVIYSEPTLLADDLEADDTGTVTWTGALPAGLTGEHTFTFQGSVDRGIVIDIAAAEVVGCPVAAAELDWGFKESFRAYLDGVADGGWTVLDGATYETPLFGFTGAGGYDATSGDADLAFTGSVRFTGHGGVLDTTIANPRVVIDGDRAVLLLDITGTTQAGEPVSQPGVEFAELDLAAAEQLGGGDLIALSGIPATLTPAGSAAFGTYGAGEALDPIDLRFTVDRACVQPVAAVDDAPRLTTAGVAEAAVWPWVIAGLVVMLLVAAAVVLLLRRRAAA